MKLTLALLLSFVTSASYATNCFELSQDGKIWETNPFTLCYEKNSSGPSEYKLTLSKNSETIAVYFLNSLPTLADGKAFGVNPMSGSFIDDSINIFIGYGEVMIGSGKYYYKE